MAGQMQGDTTAKAEPSVVRAGIESTSKLAQQLNASVKVQTWQSVLAQAIVGLYMLSFPLAMSAQLPWTDSGTAPFSSFVAVLSGSYFVEQTSKAITLAIGIFAICWMLGYVFLSIVTVTQTSNKSASEIILPISRVVSGLSTSVLLLPVAGISAASFICPNLNAANGEGWLGSDTLACTSGGSILSRVLIAAVFLVYHALLLFVTAVHFDRNPASPSWAARSHGQVDAAMLLVKMVLVICYSVLREVVLDSWFLVVLLLLAGAAWLGMSVRFLPFVHSGMNAMQAGFACVFLWSSMVLALMRYTDTGDQTLLLYMGGVLAYCGGFLACYMREQFVASMPLEACEGLVDLDVWARHRMQEYAAAIESRGSSVEQSRKGQHAAPLRSRPKYGKGLQSASIPQDGTADIAGNAVPDGSTKRRVDAADFLQELPAASVPSSSLAGSDAEASRSGAKCRQVSGGEVPYAQTVQTDGGESMATGQPQPVGRGGGLLGFANAKEGAEEEDDEDEALQGLLSPESDVSAIDQSTFFGWRLVNMQYSTRRHREDEHRLYTAERAYRQMTSRYGQTAMAHVLAAEFYHQFCFENNFAEAQALSQARLRSPTIGLEAYIRGRTRELREGSDRDKLTGLDRVIFESLSRQAQESKAAAMRSILKLWDHLSGHKLELSKVVEIGEEIEEGLYRTDELYQTMVRVNPGPLVVRGYAEFPVDLMNDQYAAIELFNKADRLEERHSRQRAKAVRHVVFGSEAPQVDLLDDNAANLTLSVSDGSVGEILSASPSACRVFGYANTSQVLGLSFYTLLPEPIRSVMNRRLHDLQRCGFSAALNQSEVSFVLPSSGGILPVIMSILESTPEEATSAPRLSVGVDVLRCDEHVLFFSGRGRGFKVLCGSPRSLLLLGVDNEQLQREPFSLSQCFPTVDHVGFPSDKWDVGLMQSILRSDLLGREGMEELDEFGRLAQELGRMVVGTGNGVQNGDKASATGHHCQLTSTGSFMSPAGDVEAGSDSRRVGMGPMGFSKKKLYMGEMGRSLSSGGPIPRLPLSLRPTGLLRVRETGVIPVENAQDGTGFVLGSVQDVSTEVGHACYMLRWRLPNALEREAMQEQVKGALEAVGIGGGPEESGEVSEIASLKAASTRSGAGKSAMRGAARPVGGRRTSFVGRVGTSNTDGSLSRPTLVAGKGSGRQEFGASGVVQLAADSIEAAGALEGGSHGPLYLHNGDESGDGRNIQGFSSGLTGGQTAVGDGAGSVASRHSQLSSQLMRAVKSRGKAAAAEVGSIKCTFGTSVTLAILGGFLSLAVGYLFGFLLSDIINRLYLATDQSLAFQTSDSDFRTIAAVEFGLVVDPGPIELRRQYDDFVSTVRRHAKRHDQLLSTDSLLSSNLAGKALTERDWTLVEPSASGGASRSFNASLQEMGTYLSSVLLGLVESNDSSRVSFNEIESSAISQNRDQYLLALNRSISLRQVDVVRSFDFFVLVFSIIGAVVCCATIGLTGWYLSRALGSIRDKTARVAQIAFMVSSRTAKKVKQRILRKLTKLANYLDEVEEDDDEDRLDLLDDDMDADDRPDDNDASDQHRSIPLPERSARSRSGASLKAKRQSKPDEESAKVLSGAAPSKGAGMSRRMLSRRSSKLKRSYSDNWYFTGVNTLFLLIPVVLGFEWVVLEMTLAYQIYSEAVSSNERLVASQRLAMDAVRLQTLSGDFIYGGSNTTRSRLREEIKVIESRILQTNERIAHGATFVDESTGLRNELDPVEDVVAKKIMLDDGCYYSSTYGECFNVSGGILRSGIRNGVISMIRQTREVRLAAPLPDLEAGSSLTMLLQPDQFLSIVVSLGETINPYMRDALERSSARYSKQSQAAVVDVVRLVYFVVSITYVLLGLGTLILYWSVPDGLSRPIRASWQILGVIPSSVLRRSKGMPERVKEELLRLKLGDDVTGVNEYRLTRRYVMSKDHELKIR